MRLLYNLGIFFYFLAINCVAWFNPKAKKWVNGRKHFWKNFDKTFHLKNPYWFHCASLGEFEQARPLIERIKIKEPQAEILITFFSPSGYNVRKDYEQADYVCYLPIDSPKNAKRFVKAVKPKNVFFIKYEFWFNYMSEIKSNHISFYLISGVFRKKQVFFKWYGGWFKKQLNAFTFFFLQDKRSSGNLKMLGFENQIISGDTRFDRVAETVKNVRQFNDIDKFCGESKVIICGSTWPDDEQYLLPVINEFSGNVKFIIAPHEINENHLLEIENKLKIKSIRYSQLAESCKEKILIVDNIGMLSQIYQYADIVYIGGAFHKKLHNVLEACAFGLPVVFGPQYQNFPEAIDLIQQEAAFSVVNKEGLQSVFKTLLENEDVYETASLNAKNYIAGRVGVADKILNKLNSVKTYQ